METQFTERMKLHWTEQSRPFTPALVEGWHQVEQATEAAAQQKCWQVVQLPTGTGKTEAMIVLCTTRAIHEHPGALIVTRFNAEADSIASKINHIAGSKIAVASHGQAKATSATMTCTPVLVITHSAYASALREAHDRPHAPLRLELYHRYHQTDRKWTFIDETFNWVDSYEVDVDELLAACGALSTALSDTRRASLIALEAFAHSTLDRQSVDRSDRRLTNEQAAILTAIDLEGLRDAIRHLRSEVTELWRDTLLMRRDGERPTTYKCEYIALFDRLCAIQQIGHCWVSRRGARTRLHSSRLLRDSKCIGGVMLDATAGMDRSYDLLGDSVTLIPPPRNIRSYRNVSIHISRSHNVGKAHLQTYAITEWPTVARELSKQIVAENRVLVITHKEVAAVVQRTAIECRQFQVTHWGTLDGRNDWRMYDTIILFGLQYLDDITPTNAFLASTNPQSDDWFSGRRQFGRHADMKTAFKDGYISKCVVQAVNRGRSRTISNDRGECESMRVFILLPAGKTGDAVTSSIRQEMPGANIAVWQAMRTNRKRRGRNECRVVSALQSYAPGIYRKSEIIAQTGMNNRTFERMSINIQKPGSHLMHDLAAIGVEYRCAIGRGKEAYFIKH
jgi:hypothetical protein